MSKKISIISTTYDKYNNDLAPVVRHIESKGFICEVIRVTDACQSCGGSVSGGEIREVFTPQHLGYYNSLRFGMLQSTGDYLYFLTDNCVINDHTFIGDAAILLNDGSDMVFGRSEISSRHGSYVMNHPFECKYSPVEFLKEWHSFRMIFVDYFGFSSILFKKDILMDAEAFISQFPDSRSLDTAALIKYVLMTREIHFIDAVACTRSGMGFEAENSDKSNMTEQVVNHFAIPIDVYSLIEKKGIAGHILHELNTFFNQYALYSFNAIVSDYHQLSNELIFECSGLTEKLKGRRTLIYGHGWVGLELHKYLSRNGITVHKFIDDYKLKDNIICFDEYKRSYLPDDAVIIANYKCSDVLKIYKQLKRLNNITVIDLL